MIRRIADHTIKCILFVIVLFLWLQSIFSTSFMGTVASENGVVVKMLGVPDYPIVHVLISVVLLTLLWFLAKKNDVCILKVDERKFLRNASIVIFLLGIFLVLTLQLEPGSDPAKVYRIAAQWRVGDFSSFAEGGYLFRYPFQAGIVLYYYLLSFVLGINNYLGLQVCNVIALVGIYYFLIKIITFYRRDDKGVSIFLYLAVALWIPFLMYSTYLYGILPGMCFSLMAILCVQHFIEKRQIRYMIFATACISVAMILKTNSLIYVVAIVCFLMFDIIDVPWKRWRQERLWKRQLMSVIFIMLLLAGISLFNTGMKKSVEHISGYELTEGEVKLSWVVMGLQDSISGPGGYSGYIGDVYTRNRYNTEEITRESANEIKNLLKKYLLNPIDEGIPFFARKTAFQWNDPTFTAMWLNENRHTNIVIPNYLQSLLNGEIYQLLLSILNYIQTLIYSGVLLYLLLTWRKTDIYELFAAVVFIGGFLFHFFWQASSSYTIPYFVILIPYAALGYLAWYRYAKTYRGDALNGVNGISGLVEIGKRQWKYVALFFLGLVLFIGLMQTDTFDRAIVINDGEDAIKQFKECKQDTFQPPAYYNISPCTESDKRLAIENDRILLIKMEEELLSPYVAYNRLAWDGKNAQIDLNGGLTRIRFRGQERVLAVDTQKNNEVFGYMDDSMNMYYEWDRQASCDWQIVQVDDSVFYILWDGRALTYCEGDLHLEEFLGSDEQKWFIR